jgi:phospholipid transport system transporter-binding protein
VSPEPTAAAETLRLAPAANGRLAAQGPLTFATARAARLAGLAALQGAGAQSLQIDCAGVTMADSAGLAVLLDWLAAAKLGGHSLKFTGLPQELTALARISELEPLLTRGV